MKSCEVQVQQELEQQTKGVTAVTNIASLELKTRLLKQKRKKKKHLLLERVKVKLKLSH